MASRGHQDEDLILEGKVYALLAYLSILCVIPLVLKKSNPFVLDHGKQGLVIFVAEVAVFILQILLGSWFFRFGIFVLGVFSFVGLIHVLRGEYVKLPYIYSIAAKINL